MKLKLYHGYMLSDFVNKEGDFDHAAYVAKVQKALDQGWKPVSVRYDSIGCFIWHFVKDY